MKAKELQTTVCSKRQAAQILASDRAGDYTHLVSIRDVHSEPLRGIDAFKGESISLQFDDVGDGIAARLAGYTPPSAHDVRGMCWFFEDRILTTAAPNVLLHCAQGESRSGAAALVLLYMFHGKWELAADAAYQAHPWIRPNETILSEASLILKCDADLIRAAARLANRRMYEGRNRQ